MGRKHLIIIAWVQQGASLHCAAPSSAEGWGRARAESVLRRRAASAASPKLLLAGFSPHACSQPCADCTGLLHHRYLRHGGECVLCCAVHCAAAREEP